MKFDDVAGMLGAKQLVGGEGFEYGDWSPNLIKTLILGDRYSYVEYHVPVRGQKYKKITGKVEIPDSSPLRVFNYKNFGALEEIYISHRILGATPDPEQAVQSVVRKLNSGAGGRISRIWVGTEEAPVDSLIDSAIQTRTQAGDYISRISDLINVEGHLFLAHSESYNYLTKYTLVPNVYSADMQGGKLESLLRELNPEKRESSSGGLGNSALDAMVEWDQGNASVYAELHSYIEGVTELPEGSEKNSLIQAIVAKLPPFQDVKSVSELPAYHVLRKMPENYPGGVPLEQCSGRGIFGGPTIEDERVHHYSTLLPLIMGEGNPLEFEDVSLLEGLNALKSSFEDSDEDDWEDEGSYDDDIEEETTLPPPPPPPTQGADINDVELTKAILNLYRGQISGTVNTILDSYDKIFASGYEVITPYGILTEGRNGHGDVRFVDAANAAHPRGLNFFLDAAWSIINGYMNLTPVPNRNISEIAEIVINGHTSKNPNVQYSGNLYFPFKMLEYAYGRKHSTGEVDSYQPHSAAKLWRDYRHQEVEKSLTALFSKVILAALISSENAESEDLYSSNEARRVVDSTLAQVSTVFRTVVMISEFDDKSNVPAKIKIRILDPYGLVPTDRNIGEEVIRQGASGFTGADPMSVTPIRDGDYVEFEFESNHTLSSVEPLFAYRILRTLMEEQGKTPSWENRIIGLDSNGRVLTADSPGIELNKTLTHYTLAGSRSGKGVHTLEEVSGVFFSGKALGYLDNKPDIGALMKHINPNGFVVNGGNCIHNPKDGTDTFGAFVYLPDEKIPNLPDYVAEVVKTARTGGEGHAGTLIYVRALMLLMGIIAGRALSSDLSKLGGEEGIVIVADELNNVTGPLTSFIKMSREKNLAGLAYHKEWVAYHKDGEGTTDAKGKPKPFKASMDKPSPYAMWFTTFYQTLRDSAEFMVGRMRNAGLQNSEARRSDIFILGQENMKFASSYEDVSKMFAKRNLGRNGVNSGSYDDDNILPTILTPASADAFLGYHSSLTNLMAQQVKESPAYKKLDISARNFGYLASYTSDRDKAWEGDLSVARKAKYFKPALIFSEGGEDKYYWTNAVNNVWKSNEDGNVFDISEQVRESNDDGNGNLHPGIGFMGYLEMAGVGPQDAAVPLQRMSDIADYVVGLMGYPGTWQEFVKDFRPEWLFSVQDVSSAITGEAEFSLDRASLREFVDLYPELFDGAKVLPRGVDLGKGFLDLDEDSSDQKQASPQESPKTFEQGTPVGKQPDITPFNVNTPAGFAQAAQEFLGVAESSYQQPDFSGTGFVAPVANQPMPTVDWQARINPNTFSPATYMQDIINDMAAFVGGWGNLRTVQIVGDMVALNGVTYQPQIQPGPWEQGLPAYIVMSVRSGNLARLLPWRIIRKTPVTGLSFDSPSYITDVMYPDLGWSKNVTVDQLFTTYGNMRTLNIRDRMFQRHNFKQYPDRNDIFYGGYLSDRLANMAVRGMSTATRKSFGYVGDSWKRSDLTGWGKTWRIGAGITGGIAVGAATVATGIGGKLLRSARNSLFGLRSSLRESRDL